jgi:DNA-binding CsgD family transcriptional regulator
MSIDNAGPKLVDGRVPALSAREVEVLLAWFGADSKVEAAAALYITSATVSTHVSRIRGKYELVGRPARTKAQLLARAIQDGYTHLDDW